MSLRFQYYSISEVNKAFLWMPPKTATTFLTFLFQHFDFYTIISDEYFYIKKDTFDYLQHMHNMSLFRGHENYELISSIRNPYSRFVSSYFYYLKRNNSDITKVSINEFLDKVKNDKQRDYWSEINNAFSSRVPDYFIRTESLYEDLTKIPFIYKSKIYKTGVLEDLVSKKMNKGIKLDNWKKYINQEIADVIYERNIKTFELVSYDKDSWKD